MRRFFKAVLVLVGMIIGAGMFGIPFVFVRAGFLTGAIELVLLAIVAAFVHRAYADVVLLTPARHRLPGYVSLYLGRGTGAVSVASALVGLSGTLLAYLVLGGEVRHAALLRVRGGAAQVLLGHLLVGDGPDHVRAGDEHVGDVLHHDDE